MPDKATQLWVVLARPTDEQHWRIYGPFEAESPEAAIDRAIKTWPPQGGVVLRAVPASNKDASGPPRDGADQKLTVSHSVRKAK